MRIFQAVKATKEQIQPEVEILVALKAEYKTLTGQDFGAPASPPATKPAEEKIGGKQKQAPTPENAAKKAAKKDARRGGGGNEETVQTASTAATATATADATSAPSAPVAAKAPATASKAVPSTATGLHYFPSTDATANTKCWLVALTAGITLTLGEPAHAPLVPRWPAITDHSTGATIFGANAVCLYLALNGSEVAASAVSGTRTVGLLPPQGQSTSLVEQILDVEEFHLTPAVHGKVRSYDAHPHHRTACFCG